MLAPERSVGPGGVGGAACVDLNPVLRGWGEYFRTGNAAKRFNQLDTDVHERLRELRIERKGRSLGPGEASHWTREPLWNLGLRCVMLCPKRPPVSRVPEIGTHGLKGGLDSNCHLGVAKG